MTGLSEQVARIVTGLLAEAKISGNDLAERLNRGRTYVSDRKTGKASWTVDDLDVIAELVHLAPFDLWREIEKRAGKPAKVAEPTPETIRPRTTQRVRPTPDRSRLPRRR